MEEQCCTVIFHYYVIMQMLDAFSGHFLLAWNIEILFVKYKLIASSHINTGNPLVLPFSYLSFTVIAVLSQKHCRNSNPRPVYVSGQSAIILEGNKGINNFRKCFDSLIRKCAFRWQCFLMGILSPFFHLHPYPVFSCSEISLLLSSGSCSYASLGSLLVASQWPTTIFLLFF